jgi:hypothetical protein
MSALKFISALSELQHTDLRGIAAPGRFPPRFLELFQLDLERMEVPREQ